MKISYPGSGNITQFGFDPLDRNVLNVEKSGGQQLVLRILFGLTMKKLKSETPAEW